MIIFSIESVRRGTSFRPFNHLIERSIHMIDQSKNMPYAKPGFHIDKLFTWVVEAQRQKQVSAR